jgi:hypothetical protein
MTWLSQGRQMPLEEAVELATAADPFELQLHAEADAESH